VFRIIKDPQFDFMRQRKLLLSVSAVLVLISIGIMFTKGLNKGIEFTGGTQIQVRYSTTPDVAQIRATLGSAGFTGGQVTTIGDVADNDIDIRLSDAEGTDVSDEKTAQVIAALRADSGATGDRDNDLNIIDSSALALKLSAGGTMDATLASSIATAVMSVRNEGGIIRSYDDLSALPGIDAGVISRLKAETTIGPLALRQQSYVGPAIGRELVRKALAAIIGSLIGMLVYIWVRFQLQWGFAAVVALAHDTILTLGLFSLFGQELSLAVVAAFLTLVGYSVNDTVVVFDRIRENLRNRGKETVEQTINKSLNQTLSRTIITSGLTWIAVMGIFLFGGTALRPFSFVLSVGVVVGTYSSIYIAAPFLVLWTEWLAKRRGATATKVTAGGNAS